MNSASRRSVLKKIYRTESGNYNSVSKDSRVDNGEDKLIEEIGLLVVQPDLIQESVTMEVV